MEFLNKRISFQRAKFSSTSSRSEEMCEEYNDIFLKIKKHTARPKSIAPACSIQDKNYDESEDIRSQSSKSVLQSAY